MQLTNYYITIYILLASIIFSFSSAVPAGACDDTLISLMTSNDPYSAFSQGIREFNRSLNLLGTSLKYKELDAVPGNLVKVMEAWLAFSNKFNVNPPDAAREDITWPAKMSEAAERIGRIRTLVEEKNYTEAHDAVLALSGRLGIFFEAVGMSPVKRRFLTGSELLIRLEQDRLGNRFQGMKSTCASFTAWLTEFRPTLASDAIAPYERILDAVGRLDTMLDGDPASASRSLGSLVKVIDACVMDLRARVLMREWFPPAPDAAPGRIGSETPGSPN
ncbi:hypothetical protein KBA41_01950 [Candidatus Ozemobacteraceae bacterium]|nr:hypothetical protein [Candidatus Ozemobacteraceae bacterium]